MNLMHTEIFESCNRASQWLEVESKKYLLQDTLSSSEGMLSSSCLQALGLHPSILSCSGSREEKIWKGRPH